MTQVLAALGAIDVWVGMIDKLAEAIRQLQQLQGAGDKRTDGVLAGLDIQLDLLADTLYQVHWRTLTEPDRRKQRLPERRRKKGFILIAPERLKLMRPEIQGRLAAVIVNVLYEVDDLQKLVSKMTSGQRAAKWTMCGYQTQLKYRLDRVESIKTLVKLQVWELCTYTNAVAGEPTPPKVRLQLRELLKPCGSAFIPKKLDGTLEWIWSHPKIVAWAQDPPTTDSDRVLCIHGATSSGKSVLTSTIAEGLTSKSQLAILFSFWAGDKRQQTLEAMFSTILWQLLAELTEEQAMKSLARLRKGLFSRRTGALIDEINQVLQSVERPLFVTIDGLNECADDWTSTTKGGLKIITDWLKMHPKLHIILAGRDTSLAQPRKAFLEHLEMTQGLIWDDPRPSIGVEPDNLPTDQSLGLRGMVSILEHRANAMFLWVELVYKKLRLSSKSVDMSNFMDSLVVELDPEYNRLAERLLRRACVSAEKRWGKYSDEAINERFDLACFLTDRERLMEAKTELVAMAETVFTGKVKVKDDTMEWINWLYTVQKKLGEFEQVADVRSKMAPLLDDAFGEKDSRAMSNLQSLTDLQMDAGLMDAAAETLGTIINKLDPTQDRWDEFRAHQKLVDIKIEQGNYSAAEPEARKCLEIAQEMHGSDGVVVAGAFSSLAEILYEQGNTKDAGSAWISAGIGYEAVAESACDTVATLLCLASGHRAAGSWTTEKLEETLRRGLAILADHKNENFGSLPYWCISLLGETLLDAQRYSEAESTWREAVVQLKELENSPATPYLKR